MNESCKNANTWKVYMHTSPSGKSYIGITSRKTYKRWGGKGQYYEDCPRFYNAIQKYGWENIQHAILENGLSFDEAINKEKYYISLYKTNNPDYGYNMTEGGLGANGYKLSDEKRMKLSMNRQGVNALGYGHFPSDEVKKKMSEAKKNRTFSDETKKKISDEKNKEVYQYTLDGIFIKKYDSASLASQETGVNIGNMCACCRNVRKNAGGFFWSYKYIDTPNTIVEHINGTNPFDVIFTRNEKSVYKLSLDGEVICMYDSIKSASEDTGITEQQISYSCKNSKSVARGYKWKFA